MLVLQHAARYIPNHPALPASMLRPQQEAFLQQCFGGVEALVMLPGAGMLLVLVQTLPPVTCN
jgi:hypothetical protein